MRNILIPAVLFLLVGTLAIFIAVQPRAVPSLAAPQPKVLPEREVIVLPVLNPYATVPTFSAQAVMVADVGTGRILYEKNPDNVLLPASTTKIVTALVALDFYSPDAVLTYQKGVVEGQKMDLVDGEQLTARDLLSGLLIYSANDAAEALAQNYPGGRESFITAMNLKATSLDLDKTYFTNPIGLDNEKHLTSARDLLKVSSFAMQNSLFREIVGTKEKIVSSVDGTHIHRLENLNELIGVVPGVTGIKTGWTEGARENLVTFVERDGRKVIMVVLGSDDRFGETKTLIDWIFENYSWQEQVY